MHFPFFLAEAILNQEIWILLPYMTFKTSLLVRKCSAIVLNEIHLNVRLNYSQQSKSIEIFIALQHFLSNKMDIMIFEKIKFPESGFSLTLATSQGSPKRSLGNLHTEMSVYKNWPLSIFRCSYHTCKHVHFHVHPLFKASGSERHSVQDASEIVYPVYDSGLWKPYSVWPHMPI